jgi:hypothetical protein
MVQSLQRSAVRQTGPITVVGYHRDAKGKWRYDSTNTLVPGAKTLTLNRTYRFARDADFIYVPAVRIRTDAALQWATIFQTTLLAHSAKGMVVVKVPLADWEDWATQSSGITAPELAPQLLLDTNRLAEILDVAASTVRAYVLRGYLPTPTVQGLSSPLWSRAVIAHHLHKQRLLQRSRALLAQNRRDKRSTQKSAVLRISGEDTFETSLDELSKRIDADLARLGITFDDGDDVLGGDAGETHRRLPSRDEDDNAHSYSDRYSSDR